MNIKEKTIKADIRVIKYNINYSYSYNYNSLSTYLITEITLMNYYAHDYF